MFSSPGHTDVPPSWNPAVGSSCQYLAVGYAVCIGTAPPSPLMPSTDPQCTSYYYVQSGDSCYDIEQAHGISADEVKPSPAK